MSRVLLVLALTGLLGACTALPAPSIKRVEVKPQYPTNLLVPCSMYDAYDSTLIEEVIMTHTNNMEKAILCKNRHNQLIQIIKTR